MHYKGLIDWSQQYIIQVQSIILHMYMEGGLI